MNFLQPWFLVFLPLILVPIIIHLINQWRYRSQPWAAMMFLLQAKAMHRGLAKLRQWLILAMRALALASLILAVSRPLASGALGRLAWGNVETTIIIFDRSPSMAQTLSANAHKSKLDLARLRLAESLKYRQSQRWVLIDETLDSPVEFSSLDDLMKFPIEKNISGSVDWPNAFQKVQRYLRDHPAREVDVWLASDMQRGDWRVQDGIWIALSKELQSLPSRLRVCILEYANLADLDQAVQIEKASVHLPEGQPELVLDLRVISRGVSANQQKIPLEIKLGASRFRTEVELNRGVADIKNYRVPLDSQSMKRGWGQIAVASDNNDWNNRAYFAFEEPKPQRMLMICERPAWIRPFQFAAEAELQVKNEHHRSSVQATKVMSPSELQDVRWNDFDIVVWQGQLPLGPAEQSLSDFVNDGGLVWFLPPASMVEQAAEMPQRLFGFRWRSWQNFESTVQPKTWRTDHELLASSQSGQSLPVGDLGLNGIAVLDGQTTPLITLPGGQPLLAECVRERGRVFLLACPPIQPYSNIARNGVVLYAAIRRSMALTNDRRASVRNITARRWEDRGASQLIGPSKEIGSSLASLNLPPPSRWQMLTENEKFLSTEAGFHAGVFQADGQLLAVNRPSTEDELEIVDNTIIPKILDGIEVIKVNDEVGLRRDIPQEIWRFFLLAMIVALIIEAWLSLPRGSSHRIKPANQAKEWASR